MRTGRLGVLILIVSLGVSPAARATLIAVGWDSADSPVYEIDESDGSGSLLGQSGVRSLNSLGVGPEGFRSSDNSGNNQDTLNGWVVSIDPFTGLGSSAFEIDLGATLVDVRGMAFDPSGALYIVNDGVGGQAGPDAIYQVDTTGSGHYVGLTGFDAIQSLAFDSAGNLWGWDVMDGLVAIDPSTGAATDVDPTDDPLNLLNDPERSAIHIQALTFVGDTLFGARNSLYEINPLTGAILREFDIAISGFDGPPDVRGIALIPEPATWALLSLGLLGLVIVHRRAQPAA